ncbi:hypothetical protein FEE95_19065 [Maribacter algarum]|uniref:Uncharacterized protein n=1 Tax=Maribacter algarum (ex Zhang et al. 2020) TaxID=2578118 RepID=A0A5S3PGB9_9FLAO|nr:hypothetical protein [Maribacter algarum]TMM53172.1 hypothetical protein FEE95_19065 [Maribacter algarum]
MKQKLFAAILTLCSLNIFSQNDSLQKDKKRLDFAKSYLELGGVFSPSFNGKRLLNNEVISFSNAASVNQTITWGAFHFWGHAEFYVSIPIGQENFKKNEETDFQLTNSIVTGARFLPWAYRDGALRPYIGVGWGATDFQQKIKPEENQPVLSKDFMLVPEAGLIFGYKAFMLRLGVSYLYDNKWNYPVSRTEFSAIETPKFNFQIGVRYSYEDTKSKDPKVNEQWNNFPINSPLGYGSTKFGDFFIAAGPSSSFSLAKSDYNQSSRPYLDDKLTSSNYFDITGGYQFNHWNLFTAISFRNPKFETEGYGAKQTIKKTSFTFEINKFLTDYVGFAPYIGLNIAYDKLNYTESIDNVNKKLTFEKIEPGVTLGWDIVPGKTNEALVLRTNLRWFPYSSFQVDGNNFDFSQLEFNLIQVVFYPERLKKRKK